MKGIQRWIGLGLLVLAAVVIGGYTIISKSGGSHAQPVTVKGLVGGEKLGFLADPQVQKILKDRYGILVDATKAGSIEMVQGDSTGQDFLWPSSEVALDLYKLLHGSPLQTSTTFSSPIVLYAWAPVADGLVRAHLATLHGGIYMVTDFARLSRMIIHGTKWRAIGLGQIFGTMAIFTTDPSKSNSGLLFAGLLGNVLNGDQVVDSSSLPTVLPEIKQFYNRLGFLESSSSDLFQQFLTTGIGAKPIIAGYENQLVEFGIQNPSYKSLLRANIRVLYPQPTVLSQHVLIALDAKGQRLLNALNDADIQRIAWEQHGFRTTTLGVVNDPAALHLVGVPKDVPAIIPVPAFNVMDRIIKSLSS